MINKAASLTKDMLHVIRDEGTEYPFSGEYNDFVGEGSFLCRRCGLALYRAEAKFVSSCGWPSFDQEIEQAVRYRPDKDGRRTEISCDRCHAHLGHVFRGEGYTKLDSRHCVNSLSVDWVSDVSVKDSDEAIFAGGCFWGLEHLFAQHRGVLKAQSGYSGGALEQPSYEAVTLGDTGHYEAVRVLYDRDRVSFKELAQYFFEIHDPTQSDGQGPDIGEQYQSVAFYYDEEQKSILQALIEDLKKRSYNVATVLKPVTVFWRAEDYHQNYYQKTNKTPYCHRQVKRF